MHKTYFTILADGDGTSIDSCNLQKGQLLNEQNCDMFAFVIIINITKPCKKPQVFLWTFLLGHHIIRL